MQILTLVTFPNGKQRRCETEMDIQTDFVINDHPISIEVEHVKFSIRENPSSSGEELDSSEIHIKLSVEDQIFEVDFCVQCSNFGRFHLIDQHESDGAEKYSTLYSALTGCAIDFDPHDCDTLFDLEIRNIPGWPSLRIALWGIIVNLCNTFNLEIDEATASFEAEYFDVAMGQAKGIFGSFQAALDWLQSPNAELNGINPIALLDTDAGLQVVLDALERIEPAPTTRAGWFDGYRAEDDPDAWADLPIDADPSE